MLKQIGEKQFCGLEPETGKIADSRVEAAEGGRPVMSRRRVWRFLPMVGVMAVIFWFSHRPGDALFMPSLFGLDKILHGLAYGVLAAAFLYGLGPRLEGITPWRIIWLTTLFCLLYGLTDEYHQTMIPGRICSLGDLAADMCGGGVAGLIYPLWLRRR